MPSLYQHGGGSSPNEILGDAVAVAALVDRPVHYAEVLILRGDRRHRLEDEAKDVLGTDPS